jgi:hypothetical protein
MATPIETGTGTCRDAGPGTRKGTYKQQIGNVLQKFLTSTFIRRSRQLKVSQEEFELSDS